MGTDSARPYALALRELRHLWPHAEVRGWQLVALFVLGLAVAGLEALSISLVVLFFYVAIAGVDDVLESEGLIGDIFTLATSILGDNLLYIGCVVFAVVVLASLVSYVNTVFAETVNQKVSERIRIKLHNQYLDANFETIRAHEPSFLLNVLEDEAWTVSDVIGHCLYIITTLCTVAVFTTLLIALSWQFALIAAFGLLVLFGLVKLFEAPMARWSEREIEVNNALTKRALSTLNCLRTIRSFAGEAWQKRRFNTEAGRVRDTYIRMERISELMGLISEVGHIALLFVFVGTAYLLGISLAGSLAAVALLHRLRPQIQSLEEGWMELVGAAAPLRHVRQIFDAPGDGAVVAAAATGPALRQEIRFENVTMRYRGATAPALDAASFRIPAAATTAIVGPSGAGKSTIVSLLLRLYRPESGSILVDGAPLDAIDRERWLDQLAQAGQDAELSDGSIAENLEVARAGAPRAALEQAARQAGILAFIEQQPDGFDMPVGERGMRLSAGQRQRIALARAFLRDPQVLILDEATSALDGALETRIRANIDAQFAGRTLIVITHRLDKVLGMDHIIVLHNGLMVEEGSPDQLLADSSGALSRMLADN